MNQTILGTGSNSSSIFKGELEITPEKQFYIRKIGREKKTSATGLT